jgi:hypothetical protein
LKIRFSFNIESILRDALAGEGDVEFAGAAEGVDMGKNLRGVKVGGVPDKRDVSKNNLTGQLKRRGIYCIRGDFFSFVHRSVANDFLR